MKNAYLYIAATAILWSGFEVAAKFIAGQFNPIQITFSRILIGGLVLLPLAVKDLHKRGISLDKHLVMSLLPHSILGQAISLSVNQLAIAFAPATAVGSIASCNPIFISIFAWILVGDKITKKNAVCFLIALVGILLIIAPWNLEISPFGTFLTILSPAIFSVYSVLVRKPCARYGGIAVNSISLILGAIELIALSMLTHIPTVASFFASIGLDFLVYIPFFSGYTRESLPYVLYVYVASTGLGFCCYYVAIEKSSVLHASLAFFLKPVLAPVYALFLLKEITAPHALIGGGCMLLALASFVLPDLIKEHSHNKKQAS